MPNVSSQEGNTNINNELPADSNSKIELINRTNRSNSL